ncbi:MAG: hypothetical protein RRY18_02930, partial [Clostridia bacterium]
RSQDAVTVGNETVKLGTVMDYYSNLYSNYYSYLQNGYVTTDQLLGMAMDSIYSSYAKLDKYKTDSALGKDKTFTHEYVETYANSKYLTGTEMDFVLKYVKYSIYTSLDNYLESELGKTYKIATKKEEDTTRDRPEEKIIDGLTKQEIADAYDLKDINEYLEKTSSADSLTNVISGYVYAETNANLTEKLKEINERIVDKAKEEDKEVDESTIKLATVKEYIFAQKQAINTLKISVKANYSQDFDEFFKAQVEQTIVSKIVDKYNYIVFGTIESNANLVADLTQRYNELVKQSEAVYASSYAQFVTDVQGLTKDSFLYSVPKAFEGKYIYVKNILVPFSTEQTNLLKSVANMVGGTTSPDYIKYRNKVASEILANDFNIDKKSEKEDDNKAVFELDGAGKVALKSGTPLFEGLTKTGLTAKDVDNLMDQYNTDTAQFSAPYEYVVRVGEVPDSYTSSWVPEFVEASNEAYKAGVGHYALCVSTYGVHIVYYDKPVEADVMHFDSQNIYKTSTIEYRFFNAYYTTFKKNLLTADTTVLVNGYKDGKKISVTDAFKKFLTDNDLKYDFEKAMDTSDKTDEDEK